MAKDKFQYFKNANNGYTVIFGANTETFDLIDVKKTEYKARLMCDTLNDILRESQNASTSDEALPIGSVVGQSEQLCRHNNIGAANAKKMYCKDCKKWVDKE